MYLKVLLFNIIYLLVIFTNAKKENVVDYIFKNSTKTSIFEKACKNFVRTSEVVKFIYETIELKADINKHHMVLIGRTNQAGLLEFHCLGSLIAPQFAITAAHCVNPKRSSNKDRRNFFATIRGGTASRNFILAIEEIYTHPLYMNSQLYHDIAVLELEVIPESQFFVPACLSEGKREQSNFSVVGINTPEIDENLRQSYSEHKINILSFEMCKHLFKFEEKLGKGLSEYQFCAEHTKSSAELCQFEQSGAPVIEMQTVNEVRMPFVVGIASFVPNSGSSLPGLYTNVTHYLDWIQSIVWAE